MRRVRGDHRGHSVARESARHRRARDARDLGGAPAINPGPFQFHGDPDHVRRWMAGKGYLFCRKGEVREIMRPIPIPGADGRRTRSLGLVRRHPSRRPRVRPRLTPVRGRRQPPGRGLTRPIGPDLSSPRPGTIWYPDLPRFAMPTGRRPSPPTAVRPSAPDLAFRPRSRCRADPPPRRRTDGRWLSLGPASQLLGIDPDTLRRWADEGRVDGMDDARRPPPLRSPTRSIASPRRAGVRRPPCRSPALVHRPNG